MYKRFKGKILEIVWDMSGPNKILEFHEKILELSNNGFSSTKTKNIF